MPSYVQLCLSSDFFASGRTIKSTMVHVEHAGGTARGASYSLFTKVVILSSISLSERPGAFCKRNFVVLWDTGTYLLTTLTSPYQSLYRGVVNTPDRPR